MGLIILIRSNSEEFWLKIKGTITEAPENSSSKQKNIGKSVVISEAMLPKETGV